MSVRIERSALAGNRADLARLCNHKGIRLAVEVGTDRGLFAREFLDRWNGETLFCVDTWAPCPEHPWGREGDLAMAVHTLAPYASRVRMLRCKSSEAAVYFGDAKRQYEQGLDPALPPTVGFVYIDAGHDYGSVTLDLLAWLPVVAPGGIIAGDDFGARHEDVLRAVTEMAEHVLATGRTEWAWGGEGQAKGWRRKMYTSHELVIRTTTDYDREPSWYLEL